MPNQKHPTSLRMADGGTFMKGIKRIWSGEATASPPPAPPPAPAPSVQRAITSYTSNPALEQRMKAAGLRDGGELRLQEGGGLSKEAVLAAIARQNAARPQAAPAPAPQSMARVAGDSLRDPGSILRSRERVAGLQNGGDVPGAGKGDKIPALYEPGEFVVSNAMLDTAPGLRDQLHTLRNGVLAAQGKTPAEADAKALRGTGLRALDGFDVTERPWNGSADSRAFARDPGPGNPNVGPNGSAQARSYDAGSTRSQYGNSQGSVAGAQGRGAVASGPGVGDQARGVGGPGVHSVQEVGGKPSLRAAVAEQPRALGKASVLGGRAIAKVAPWAAAAGAFDALGNYRINDPDVDSSAGGTLRALGAGDWGGAGRSLSKGALEAGMDIGGFAADTADIFVPGQPFSKGYNNLLRDKFGDQLITKNSGEAAASDAPASSLRSPASSVAAPVQSGSFGAPPGQVSSGLRRIAGGSSPLFSNQSDEDNAKLMGRGQVSAQNMNAADALAGRYQAEARASLREPEAPQANGGLYVGADTGGYGLLDKGYQRERSLRMDGARRDLSAFRKESNEAPRRAAELAASQQAAARSDETTRRGQDLELDGRTMTARSAASTARFNALREQANKDRDFDASQRRDDQTMGDTARKGLAEEMKVFGPDGKLDEGASAASVAVAQQLFPGIDRLTPEARSKVMPDVKEMAAIFNKAKDQDKVGFDALKFWEPARPSLRSMPDAKGGTTEEVSGLGGWFTAGAENGDTLLNNNGKTLNLGPLNERQRELLKRAQTNGWGQ